MVDVKFKALYTNECSAKADLYGRAYSFILALASASSVAAWSIWDSVPFLWVSIVAVSQVMHVAKPYFPFIKNNLEFIKMSYSFEKLYLDIERLWFSIESENIDPKEAEDIFYRLKKQVVTIEHEGVNCPEITKWKNEITEKTLHYVGIHFSRGE